MFKMKSAPPAPVSSPFVECRSWGGISIHIRDRRDSSGNALCGYEPLSDLGELVYADFFQQLATEHAGRKYCGSCAVMFGKAHS